MLTEGTITVDAIFAARRATRVIAPNELIRWMAGINDSLPVRWGWTVLEPTTIERAR